MALNTQNSIIEFKNITPQIKKETYELLSKQINATLEGETNLIAKMATISCMLKSTFESFYWCGFYIVDTQKEIIDELVVGPYQGTLGCLRIKIGRGVCGTSWKLGKTQIVDDVHKLENHIACDSASNSEIVVPVYQNAKIIAVLDVDSTFIKAFDEIDKKYLEQILAENF